MLDTKAQSQTGQEGGQDLADTLAHAFETRSLATQNFLTVAAGSALFAGLPDHVNQKGSAAQLLILLEGWVAIHGEGASINANKGAAGKQVDDYGSTTLGMVNQERTNAETAIAKAREDGLKQINALKEAIRLALELYERTKHLFNVL